MRPGLIIPVLLAGLAAAAAEEARQRAGRYEITLRPPPDGLYAEEEMEIEFRVVDTSQVDPVFGPTPVVRAQIRSTIDMPSMPGMPSLEEVAHPEGVPGDYGVHPTFAHGGEYRIRLEITPPGEQPFAIEFPLQVLDATEARKRKPRPRPFQLELITRPKSPKAGEPVELQLVIRAREKPKEVFAAFQVVHEKLMHLLIVRKDLTGFAHEHPEQSGDGAFRHRYVFPTGGDYHLFADVAPRGAGSQVLMAKLKVGGKAAPAWDVTRAAAEQRVMAQQAHGVSVELKAPGEPLPSRKTLGIAFALKDAATQQAITDLQPYLGAMGHLILIHQDGVTFVHSHPDERRPGVGRDGTVPFLLRFPKPGFYRAWSQFQRNDRVLTSEFILRAGE